MMRCCVWSCSTVRKGGWQRDQRAGYYKIQTYKYQFLSEISQPLGFSSGGMMLILPHGLFQARVA